MARDATPFLQRGWFISRAGGKYLRLCPEAAGKDAAKRLLRERLVEMDLERAAHGGQLVPGLTVTELFARFLRAVETETSPENFRNRKRWCREFDARHGSRPARAVSRLDAEEFKHELMTARWVRPRQKQPPRPYKPKSINHALETLRRAFSWAIEVELLPHAHRNPFGKIKLLRAEGRARVATEEEYQALLRHCGDHNFRDVLVAMRHTAARPQDVRQLRWEMVHWDSHMWYITRHKAMKTARDPRPRIIGMCAEVEDVLRRRREAHGDRGHVFLNRNGKPWTKDALVERMARLRKRAGVKPDANGEQFVLYTNRHTFLTAAAKDPTISEAVLTELAGHTDSRTTWRYTHLANQVVSAAGRRVADSLRPQREAPSE